MSDNVTNLELEQSPEPRKGLVKRIVIFAVIVVAVCAFVALVLFSDGLNIDSLRRMVKYMNVAEDGTYGSYAFDSHSNNRYASFDGGLVVASVSGLNSYNESGEEVFVLQEQLELPELLANGSYAVAYDVGGKDLLMLHRRNGEVLHLEESRPIIDADLSEKGYLCISSSASGYKSVLSVYNQQQELVYRWLSSTTHIPLCSVSSNGAHLAAVALGQSDGVFESTVYLFQTNSEEVQKTVSLGSQLFYDLMFVSENVLCAVGEDAVTYLNVDGEVLGTYSYGERYLKDFHAGGDGFLTVALNMYRAGNRYSLATVDEKGQLISESYLGQEILDLSACGKYIAVLTPEGLTIFTQSLTVYHQTVETGNATAVVMQEDGSVLLLGNGQGHLYVP